MNPFNKLKVPFVMVEIIADTDNNSCTSAYADLAKPVFRQWHKANVIAEMPVLTDADKYFSVYRTIKQCYEQQNFCTY